MKNKQKNGQKMDSKMAKALKIRCDALEDCVVSQQATITERESEIVNLRLSESIARRRYDEAMKYLELNRPEILQLMKVSAKHGVLAAQGKAPSVTVKLVKRKLKAPKIPQQDIPKVSEVSEVPVSPSITEAREFLQSHGLALQVTDSAPVAPQDVPKRPTGSSAEVYNFKTKTWEATK